MTEASMEIPGVEEIHIHDPIKEIKHWFDKVKHEAEHGIHKIEDAEKSAVSKIEGAEKHAVGEVEKAAKDVASKALAEIKSDLKKLEQEVMAAITSEALHKAVKIIDKLAPTSMALTVGPIRFTVDNPVQHRDTLLGYANKPPKSREDYKNMVKAILPDTVTVILQAQLAALVVTSSDASIELDLTFSVAQFVEAADDILKEVGL